MQPDSPESNLQAAPQAEGDKPDPYAAERTGGTLVASAVSPGERARIEQSLPGLRVDGVETPNRYTWALDASGLKGSTLEKLDPEARDELSRDGMKFLDRAGKSGLSPEEVHKFYGELNQLLEHDGAAALPADQRLLLARQIMRHAADPTTIDQGAHPTCQMTAVEKMAFAHDPARAANLLKQVALTGEYRASNGTTVKLDGQSLLPDVEARAGAYVDGKRDFATQLFNVTAMNIALANRAGDGRVEQYSNLPDGKTEYTARDKNGNPLELLYEGLHWKESYPHITAEEFVRAHNTIVGRNEPDALLRHQGFMAYQDATGALSIGSQQQLEQELQRLQRAGKLPIMVNYQDGRTVFGAKGETEPHVVTIMEYKPGPPAKVGIDNQWGTKADRLGASAMNLTDLYSLMVPASEHAARLERATATPDHDPKLRLEKAFWNRRSWDEEIEPTKRKTYSDPGFKSYLNDVVQMETAYRDELISSMAYAKQHWQRQEPRGKDVQADKAEFVRELNLQLKNYPLHKEKEAAVREVMKQLLGQ